MTARRATARRVAVVGLTTVLVGVAVVAAVAQLGVPAHEQTRPAQVLYLLDPIVFCATGALLVLQRPGNVVAWALWSIGLSLTSSTGTEALLNAQAAGRPVPAGLLSWALWLEGWGWLPAFLALVVLLLRFPSGHLQGRWWRRLELLVVTTSAIALVLLVAAPQGSDYPGVAPPFRSGLPGWLGDTGTAVGFLPAVGAFVLAAAGLLTRFRRSRGIERAQLQWLLFAAGSLASTYALIVVLELRFGGRSSMPPAVLPLYDLLGQVAVPLVPAAIFVSVTRHGLFEIDRLVSRTVSYAVVVGLLAVAYAAVVTSVSAVVPDSFGSVAVVLATLAVSGLFVPVRRQVVAVVDRRFNRTRYDADQVVAAFAERVRSQAGTGTTGQDLVAAAEAVLQPASAGVWVVPR